LARQELAEQIRAAAALPKRLLLVEFSNDPQAPFVPSSYATYAYAMVITLQVFQRIPRVSPDPRDSY